MGGLVLVFSSNPNGHNCVRSWSFLPLLTTTDYTWLSNIFLSRQTYVYASPIYVNVFDINSRFTSLTIRYSPSSPDVSLFDVRYYTRRDFYTDCYNQLSDAFIRQVLVVRGVVLLASVFG